MSTPTSTPSPVSPAQLRATLAAAFLGWMFDGMEMGLFPLVARPALLEMQQAHGMTLNDAFVGLWMGRVTAAFLLGAALGGVVFGWLGDRFGRVKAMAWSIACYSVFTGLIYFAAEPWHLGAFRFIAALGMGGEWALGVALVMEVWPENKRPLMAGVIGAAANVGYVIIGLVGLSFKVTTETWRWVAVVGAAPAVLTFAVMTLVPESQKWHASTQTPTGKPAGGNPLREIFGRKLAGKTFIAIALSSVALIGTWGSVQWLPLWADKLAGATNPYAKAYTQIASALGAVIACLIGAWACNLVSRRLTYFLLSLASLGTCAWLFRGVDAYGPMFLALTFAVGGATAMFYGWLPLYLPELFPTRVRATGQGLAFNSGRILAAVGALQMGSLMQAFDGSYAKAGAIISLVYVLGLGLIWAAPETKGQPLPE